MIRKFLLLQGPVGPFFGILARQIRNSGHDVVKVNFNGGDEYFFSKANITGTSIDYEGTLEGWNGFISNLAKSASVTDLVVYGDCRPVHKIAIEALKQSGIRIHVIEEGYFRPKWITYEENGVNGYSALPRNPEFYRQHEIVPLPESPEIKGTFRAMSWFVTQYYFAHVTRTIFGRFKNYKWHFAEGNHHKAYWAWWPKYIQIPFLRIEAFIKQKIILGSKYFLVPLQLCRDFQISEHSDFANMEDFIKYVIENFSKSAPEDVKLVIKNHPLDPSFCGMRCVVNKVAEQNKVKNRVIFIDGGQLPTLMDSANGVITVNSTVGLQSIHHKIPTLVLGRSFYAIEGLVNKNGIAEFFNNPQKPDNDLYKHFRNYVMLQTQASGSFYEERGMERAATKIAAKMTAFPS